MELVSLGYARTPWGGERGCPASPRRNSRTAHCRTWWNIYQSKINLSGGTHLISNRLSKFLRILGTGFSSAIDIALLSTGQVCCLLSHWMMQSAQNACSHLIMDPLDSLTLITASLTREPVWDPREQRCRSGRWAPRPRSPQTWRHHSPWQELRQEKTICKYQKVQWILIYNPIYCEKNMIFLASCDHIIQSPPHSILK